MAGMGGDCEELSRFKAPAAELSSERTARREDGSRMKTSEELQLQRSDSFMTPLPGATEPPSSGSPDEEEIPKCKLAFEEDHQKDNSRLLEADRLDAPVPKPRTNRTTATKVSASLISKIENNESGCDLKITSLIPFDHLAQLCHALAKNESTERLDLEGCGVGDKGCVLIKDLLMGNKVIKHVDLQMNQITDVGCRHLAEILPRNTTLHKLYLGYNDIRDDGVYALIGAMRPRGQLEVIVNGNTHVSDQALTRLDRALDQQWRSGPKPKKELTISTESPKTSTRRSRAEDKDDRESETGEKVKRARTEPPSSIAKNVVEEKILAMTLDEDIFVGPPFEFKFVSTLRLPTEAQAHVEVREAVDGPSSDQATRPTPEMRLHGTFNTQWERFRNLISEMLTQESRDFSLPRASKSVFQSACNFLSVQYSEKSAVISQRRILRQEQERWKSVVKDGRLSEGARRKAVEQRLHELLVKFRHMEEDIARQQRSDAMNLLAMQPAFPQSEEQGPCGLVLVPCPFRVHISLAHLDGEVLTT